jgi:hypothetical protein
MSLVRSIRLEVVPDPSFYALKQLCLEVGDWSVHGHHQTIVTNFPHHHCPTQKTAFLHFLCQNLMRRQLSWFLV